MPADTGSGPVLIDSSLPKFIHVVASEFRHLGAQFVEKRRKITCRFHSSPGIIVSKPETSHTSITQMAVGLERLEFQLL
jgi:hypothetical protein